MSVVPSYFHSSDDFNVNLNLKNDSEVFVDVEFCGNKKQIALEIIFKPIAQIDSYPLISSDLTKITIAAKKDPCQMSDAEKLAIGMEELIKNNPRSHPFSQYSTEESLLDQVKFSLFRNAVFNYKESVRKNVWQHLSKPLSFQLESFIRKVFEEKCEFKGRNEAAVFAAQIDRLDILKIIIDSGPVSSSALGDIVFEAALNRRFDILHYLCSLDADLKTSSCQAARQAFFKNDLEVLEILISSGKIDSNYFGYLVLASVEKKSEEMLNFLLPKNRLSLEDLSLAILQATKGENLTILRLLNEKGFINRNEILQSEYFQTKIAECLYTAAVKKKSDILNYLISNIQPSNVNLQQAIFLSVRNQTPNVTNFLLSAAPQRFYFNAGLIRSPIILALTAHSDIVNLEYFLHRCGPITAEMRNCALENARGPNAAFIIDMLRLVPIFDDSLSSLEEEIQPGIIHVLSWEDVKQNPLKYIELALSNGFQRVKFADSKAIDLGGVSKQFITTLFNGLIESKILNLDYVHKLPLLTRPINPEQEKALILLSKFLSLIDKKNEARSDKFLIGTIFDPLFFGFLKSNPSLTFQSYLEIRNADAPSDLVALLKDPHDQTALSRMGTAFKDVDENMQSVEDWRYGIEKAAEIIRCHLSGSFKQKLDALQTPSDFMRFSMSMQGIEATPEQILKTLTIQQDALNICSYSLSDYLIRVEWLKEWISKLDHEEVSKFVNCVTGRQTVDDLTKITIRPSHRGSFEVHTCLNTLDIPPNNSEISQKLFESIMNTFIKQKDFNSL